MLKFDEENCISSFQRSYSTTKIISKVNEKVNTLLLRNSKILIMSSFYFPKSMKQIYMYFDFYKIDKNQNQEDILVSLPFDRITTSFPWICNRDIKLLRFCFPYPLDGGKEIIKRVKMNSLESMEWALNCLIHRFKDIYSERVNCSNLVEFKERINEWKNNIKDRPLQ